MFTHEDNRRTLIEWATGEFKVAKVLIAKEDCVVGDHWHRHKDETFLLVKGSGKFSVGDITCDVDADIDSWISTGGFYISNSPMPIEVPRGTYHRFELAKGSILLGVGTEAFDPKDEIAGRPPEGGWVGKFSGADPTKPEMSLSNMFRECDDPNCHCHKIIEGGT